MIRIPKINLMSKTKRLQAATALAIAVLIALAGAFAWFSFNQRKQNIFNIISSPNVNLHDDFAGGPQKNVYVENSGRNPVLVRVRLSELMNIGGSLLPEDAIDSDYAENWHIHKPSVDNCDTCAFEAHQYFQWVMNGQKFYMPAHQSAKGSNTEGGYAEPVAVGEKEKIIDYKTLLINAFKELYSDDEAKLNAILGYINEYLGGDDTNAKLIKQEIAKIPDSYTVSSVKQYEGQPETEYTRKLNEVSLTLIPSRIISIYDWLSGTTYGEQRKTGDFWVMDSDGWCYWAGVLEGGQATGLLMSSVTYANNYSGDNMIYKINVNLNATTFEGSQLSTFFIMAEQNGGITEAAMILMFLSSGEYIMGADGEIYLIEGGGMYRKIERNPNTNNYVNYTIGKQIYAGPGSEPGGGGISAGGTYILGADGKLTDSGVGSEYKITYITKGANEIVYLETENGIFLCPVDEYGNPDKDGDTFAIASPGADGGIGTADDIGPIRADGTFPQWYLADISAVGGDDVIEAGNKGTLIWVDSAGQESQGAYKVTAIVKGENGIPYLRLEENMYAAALDAEGRPVTLARSHDKDGEPIFGIYYIVYPDGDGKIGTEDDNYIE